MNTIFKFEENTIRTFIINEEVLFVGVDIARALGYKDASTAVKDKCDDGKHYSYKDIKFSLGDSPIPEINNQGVTLIPESDVYSLVFSSSLPNAKAFKSWLTKEVIPQIRKTGSYAMKPMTQLEIAKLSLEKLIELEERTVKNEEAIAKITAKQTAFEEGLSYFTVLGYGAYKGITIDLSTAQKIGREAAKLSKEKGVPIDRTKDARFGMVNNYHERVLDEVVSGML